MGMPNDLLGGVLYSWSGGINNNSSFVPDSSQTFIVNGTDINGCENTDSVLVQVNSLPTVFAGYDTSICYLDTITLNAIMLRRFYFPKRSWS